MHRLRAERPGALLLILSLSFVAQGLGLLEIYSAGGLDFLFAYTLKPIPPQPELEARP